MIDASDPEFIRLLARLKLSVRRQLEYNIDLARLQKDAQQALEVLKEIEDMAEDEELLALILRLRAIIMQNSSKDVLEKEKIADPSVEKNSSNVRSYRFGARGG
ncbi:MAG: hypothetical protein KBB07_07085 [Tepidiphilus sp.]|jgi:hypothetical protein|uniref:Uncharacterized protein n=1 Tax=Tepidiphilus thermophilus TaxID=876478 RepID=A0A0K6IUT7_9PROT|nr:MULTISPECIES: hypothetical protein [Tepidiphilus]MBP6999400.1 hypothetical protein [Tepidiphilus sp.]MDK2797663.1 hypothetical protein [Tepidiphilus sp.]CUB06881.1 hypothetical protein Ga0061068_10488 [Tepidiphilus thermophilus]